MAFLGHTEVGSGGRQRPVKTPSCELRSQPRFLASWALLLQAQKSRVWQVSVALPFLSGLMSH